MREVSLESCFNEFQQTGDAGVLAEIFDATAGELLAVARHLTSDRSEAEDLLQETFLTAIKRSESYDANRRLKPWLLGILTKHAATARRRAKRTPDPRRMPTLTVPDPTVPLLSDELHQEVERAIRELPSTYQEVLLLRMRGERNNAIANQVGREPGMVRMQITRGLRLLRRALPAGLATSVFFGPASRRSLAAIRDKVLAEARLLSGTTYAAAPSATLFGGILIMKKLALVVGVFAIVGVSASLLWDDSAEDVVPISETSVEVARSAATPKALSPPPVRLVAEVVAPVDNVASSEEAPRSYLEKLAGLRGLLLEANGSPAGGLNVQLLELAQDDLLRSLDSIFEEFSPMRIVLETTRTDDDGSFRMGGALPRGLHALGIDLGGSRATLRFVDVELLPGQERDLGTIYLEPVVTFRGIVVDEEEEPVADARVRVIPAALPLQLVGAQHLRAESVILIPNKYRPGVVRPPAWAQQLVDQLPLPTAITDRDGRFVIDGVPSGVATTIVDHPRFVATVKGPTPTGTSGRDLGVIVLEEGRHVTGVVVDGTGAPIVGAEVAAGVVPPINEGILGLASTTDAKGQFSIGPLPLIGAVQYAARANALDNWTLPSAEDVDDVTISLPDGFDATIRLVDEEGTPIGGATLLISLASPVDRIADYFLGTTTAPLVELPNSDGLYRAGPFAPGRYYVHAKADSFNPLVSRVTLGETFVAQEIQLARGVDVTVHVIDDATSLAIEHALVTVTSRQRPDFPAYRSRTTIDGLATIGPVGTVGTSIRVTHPGYAPVVTSLPEATTEITVRASTGCVVEGVLASDLPLNDPYLVVVVQKQGNDLDQFPYVAATDMQGRFTFRQLAPGRYEYLVFPHLARGNPLQLSAAEFDKLDELRDLEEGDFTVVAGETTRLVIPFFPLDSTHACRVEGLVSYNGIPRARAAVSVSGTKERTSTDANGQFAIENIQPGETSIWVRLGDDGLQTNQSISLRPGEVRFVRIDVKAREQRVRVVDGTTRLPIVGQPVSLTSVDGITSSFGTTDQNGEAVLACGPGRHTAMASSTHGFARTIIEQPSDVPVELEFVPGTTFKGTFTLDEKLRDGRSSAILWVSVAAGPDRVTPCQVSSVELEPGQFDVRGLPPGKYELTMRSGNNASLPVWITLTPEGVSDLHIDFASGSD